MAAKNQGVYSPDGALYVTLTTAVALGITMGNLNYRLFVLRP